MSGRERVKAATAEATTSGAAFQNKPSIRESILWRFVRKKTQFEHKADTMGFVSCGFSVVPDILAYFTRRRRQAVTHIFVHPLNELITLKQWGQVSVFKALCNPVFFSPFFFFVSA